MPWQKTGEFYSWKYVLGNIDGGKHRLMQSRRLVWKSMRSLPEWIYTGSPLKSWKCQSCMWTVTPLADSLPGCLPLSTILTSPNSHWKPAHAPAIWQERLFAVRVLLSHFLDALGCQTLTNSIWQLQPHLNNYVDGQRVQCQCCLSKSNKTVIVFLQFLHKVEIKVCSMAAIQHWLALHVF